MTGRTLSEADAVLEIADTLMQLPDDDARHRVVATAISKLAFGMLPLATFGDMDRPVGPELLAGGTGDIGGTNAAPTVARFTEATLPANRVLASNRQCVVKALQPGQVTRGGAFTFACLCPDCTTVKPDGTVGYSTFDRLFEESGPLFA